MKTQSWFWMAPFTICLIIVQNAAGQTLLKRLSDQIERNLPREASPPREGEQRGQAPTREDLPPPRESRALTSPARISLGIRVSPVTDELMQVHQLVVRRGAVITAIERGSPADQAGLPLGGVIVAFDGRRIDSPNDLVQAVRTSRPGQDVELTYYQRDRLARKSVHLLPAQSPDLAPPLDPQQSGPATGSRSAAPAGPSLEQQLGAGGSRPILGRIGRAIDSVVTPAQALDPSEPTVVNRIEPNSEIALLREQVNQLQKQIDAMQKQIESLEKKLAEKQ